MATSASSDLSSLFTSGATAATASVATAAGVAGFDYSGAGSKTLHVDATAVARLRPETDQATLVATCRSSWMWAAAASYTVAADGANGFTITTAATGASSAMTIAGADAAFVTANVAGADAVAPATAAPLTLAPAISRIGGTDMAGTYKDAQSLVDAVNSKGIAGVSAFLRPAPRRCI